MQSSDEGLLCLAEEMVVSAARADPRFSPIPPEDLPATTLGITVLGAERPWPAPRDPAQLRIGVDGLRIRFESRTGVLLPQVAVEWGYDGTQFLEATCRKAGLDGQAWQRAEVEVSCFEGQEKSAPYRDLVEDR